MKKYLIILFLLAGIISTYAFPYKIKYLTADEGLSRNLVHHIFKDSKGFMWIATDKGLDRYDGYNFEQYNSLQRENPLPNDVVLCVEEDENGDLWIGTENGLFFLDYMTGLISPAGKRLNSAESYLEQRFNFIYKCKENELWLGHSQGLSVIRKTEGGEYHLEDVYESNGVRAMIKINGNIFVGEDNRLFRVIKDNNQHYMPLDLDEELNRLDGNVNTLFHDNGLIWIGTSIGLYRYDPNTERITHYLNEPGNINSLSSNTITDIKRSKEGQLLVGTLIGLNIYDYQLNNFTRITSERKSGTTSLNNNFVSSIYADENMIWVGTEKGGVNLLFPDQRFFSNVMHQPDDPTSLSPNPVNAILEDQEGDLWVGTVEGGLNIRKKGSEQFIHIKSRQNDPRSLSHNSVSSLCQDYQGDYWIGTWGYGLNFLDNKRKNRPVFEQYFDNDQSEQSIQSNFVAAIVADELNEGIWIGTVEGLEFMDKKTRKTYPILAEIASDEAIRLVTGLLIDKSQQLWVGSGNGLYKIDLTKSRIKDKDIAYQHFRYELSIPGSRIVEKINCILQTKDNRLWMGSNGNGIYLLEGEIANPTFKKIDISNGLIDNVVYGMLEDEVGTIWISTDKGLCAYNPHKDSFRNFNIVDGLASNQFYWDAYFKGADGKMYFGHVNGFTVFDPMKYIPIVISNRVAVTRVSVLNEDIFPARTQKSVEYLRFENSELKKIILRESDKAFSIEFSALSYFLPDKIKYAYRLKGFDDEWKVVTADRRFANFTNIGYGHYEFEVKSSNADGSWSDLITTLEIRVIPPFFKQWWFISLMLILIVYGTYSFINYRLKSMRRQELHLKQLVHERTQEIEQQKEMLQEATVDKITFFTNITHEFRTPITLILGPVERALKLSTNPKVLEQLNIVRRNSKLLLTLINQLMDFRKVESEKMVLSKSNQNFEKFLDEIILPFEDMAKDRGISFRKQYRISPPEFLFDIDSMQKVMGNLLSNAIKFTPDNGTIAIIASNYTDKSDQKEKLYVAVKDTGKGIPEGEQEKIFERFYQSKKHEPYSGSGQSSTGIGLYLCKKIIDLYEGRIEALNSHTGGAVFRFIIPIERRPSTLVSIDGNQVEVFLDDKKEDQDIALRETLGHGKPLLLIVEDNNDMRQYIRSILSEEYNILEAPNGVVGLELTNRYLPDLIISDIMMPEMDGVEFCRRVKLNFNTSHIPVVLLTAKSSTDTQIESFQVGADAFLVKPFDEELLKALLVNLAEKRKKMQHNFVDSMDISVLNFEEESQDKKFVDKALKIINQNYSNPDFDVAEFIEAMGISRSLLHKKLTNLTGQSASRFIRTYRLNTARELIIKNRNSHAMNISEIAYQVGFNDPKYFTRCFTKQFGIQPSSFLEEKK